MKLMCDAPIITNVNISKFYGIRVQYKLMLDGAASPNVGGIDLALTLQPDPVFTGIDSNSRTISVDNDLNDDITIIVSYIYTGNCRHILYCRE